MRNTHGIAKECDMFVPFKGVIDVAVGELTPHSTPLGAMPFAPGTIDRLIVHMTTHGIGGRR